MPGICGTCPDCGSDMYYDEHYVACAMFRVHDQMRQMQERSGPGYELSVTRARAGTAAWRAAGAPRRVTLVTEGHTDADGTWRGEHRWVLAAPYKRGQLVDATPEQVAAWKAWRAASWQA
jgi:hypothetical protein